MSTARKLLHDARGTYNSGRWGKLNKIQIGGSELDSLGGVNGKVLAGWWGQYRWEQQEGVRIYLRVDESRT